MRRGLMGWNADELPKATLDERVGRLQAAMRRDGFDAFLFYSNLVRPSAVCWLTGFTPYWIESLLLVGQDGAPLLATALSKRVSDWIRATSQLGEIINTPKPGTAIAQRLAASGAKRIGVLELDALPGGLFDDITAAAPAGELVDATGRFATERRHVDAAERALIERADTIAKSALDQVDAAQIQDAGALAGLVEKHARLDAAEEAYIAIASDLAADPRMIRVSKPALLADCFAVRASVAYKGSWVRRTRTFARSAAGARAVAAADAWFDPFVRSIANGTPLPTQITAKLARLPGAELKGWMLESCIGSYPLEVVAGSGPSGGEIPTAGTFFVLSMELLIDGVPWLGAAPGFVAG